MAQADLLSYQNQTYYIINIKIVLYLFSIFIFILKYKYNYINYKMGTVISILNFYNINKEFKKKYKNIEINFTNQEYNSLKYKKISLKNNNYSVS